MLLGRFSRQSRRRRGADAGACALPLFGFVGAAVDYSRAASVRTAMQSALDATALMLSKDAENLSSDALSQKAIEYFNALFTRPEAHGVQVTPSIQLAAAGQLRA